ncbi:MAG: nucleotidyltransferase family protein [Pseudomonadota bacterium]
MSWPIMFFAAGLGTRMGALTQDRPKPLINVAGKPLINHAMGFADNPRFGPQVVNLHYKAEMLRDHLRGRDIRFADETDQLLDTGGGLRAAWPLLGDGPVMTMNTDAVWRGPNPLDTLANAWQGGIKALLLLVPVDNAIGHKGRGDFHLAADGQLTRGPGMIYTGAQIIDPSLLSDITDDVFSLNRAWDIAAAEGQLFGAVYDGMWCDVGQPESIPLAEAMYDV